MKDYLKLFKFVLPYLGLLCGASLVMAVSTLFNGISLGMIVPLADKVLTDKEIILPYNLPDFASELIHKINAIAPLRLLYIMAVVILCLFLLKGIFGFWQSYLMRNVGQRVVRDVRLRLYKKFQDLSLDYYSQRRSPELVSRITNDVGMIENAVCFGLTDLIYQSLQIVLFAFIIFFIHWRLAMLSLVIFPLVAFPVVKVGRILRRLSRRIQERMADINSLLYETFSGVRIVKAFNMEDYEISRFENQNRDYYRLTMKSIKRVLLLTPITDFIGAIAAIFIFLWAGRDVVEGRMSFGIFGLFLGSLLSLIRPFKKLSVVNSTIQQAIAASSRIYEVLDAPSSVVDRQGVRELPLIKQEIYFKGVFFSYEKEVILKNINLKIKAGEVVAIAGRSGVGKSTLVNLLLRFYDPQQGAIYIDGLNIKDVSLKSLRRQMGLVSQETILFNDTLRQNIAYGTPKATNRQIEEAAKQAFAHNFIQNLPDGYQTVIGDRGFKLSGGEKQRIAIARAILKNPPILILDEATSQIDSQSESLIQEALNRLMQGRTVLVIAHRLSTIRKADRIVVLDKGELSSVGTHENLLKTNDLYSRLYHMQFK